MNLEISIKNLGFRHGTVGWLKSQLELEELLLEESNNFYLPAWSDYGGCNILTHGLIIHDKKGTHSALLAYRGADGRYQECVAYALGNDEFSHWPMNLTEAAQDALGDICIAWISTLKERAPLDDQSNLLDPIIVGRRAAERASEATRD